MKKIPHFNILNLKNDKNQTVIDVAKNETVLAKLRDHIRFINTIRGRNFFKRKDLFKDDDTDTNNKKIRTAPFSKDITGEIVSFLARGGYRKKTKKRKRTQLKKKT